jgi:hypothetical protein
VSRRSGARIAPTRRRLRLWAEAGLGEQLHELVLDAYDRMIGLELVDVGVDGAITTAPCAGDRAGRSGRPRQGRHERSTGVDGNGIPLGLTGTTANRHDSPLLRDTFEACSTQLRHRWPEQVATHLDRAYDNGPTRNLLDELGFNADIARKASPPRSRSASAGGRTNIVDERLRQDPPMHRPQRQVRRLLPLPGSRHHHNPSTLPPRPYALPLGYPAHHPQAQVTPFVGRSNVLGSREPEAAAGPLTRWNFDDDP